MKTLLYASAIILGIVTALGLATGAWYLQRTINYNLIYKDCVQQTVKEMVKQDCLKNNCP